MKIYSAIQIRFTPEAEDDADLRDRLAAALDDFAPTAIEESAAGWRVFFQSADARARALDCVRGFDERLAVDAADVPDEDWAQRSQANIGSIQAGRIVVSPPWAVTRQPSERTASEPLEIVIVPSMGFGTGHHASTRLCLTLLQEVALAGRSALDLGTGSGVLAIAAALLGADPVVAVDNDPDAVESARENLALNGARSHVQLSLGDFRRMNLEAADVVLANLTGELLRRTAADVCRATRAGGVCIVSGVLATEEAVVTSAFDGAGLHRTKLVSEEEWVGMSFVKREA